MATCGFTHTLGVGTGLGTVKNTQWLPVLTTNWYALLEVDSVEDDPEASPDLTNETTTVPDVQPTHPTIPNSPSPPAPLGVETPSQVCGCLHPFGEFPTP